MYTQWFVAYEGETATPSRPPSPPGRAALIRWTSLTTPRLLTRRTRLVSRSVTSAEPSGRKASPHGVVRPLARTRTTPGAGRGSAPPKTHRENQPVDISTAPRPAVSAT